MNLHHYLVGLKNSKDRHCVGICNNRYSPCITSPEGRRLRSLMQSWPKYSGNPQFPIPHPEVVYSQNGSKEFRADAAEHAYRVLPRWEGTYGELRMELLGYLIKQTEPNGE